MEITLQRTGVRRQCGQEVLATTETRAERAFYDACVIELPTPRWTTGNPRTAAANGR